MQMNDTSLHFQEQGAGDDGDRAEGHSQAGHPRLQGQAYRHQNTGRHRNTNQIVEDGPAEVDANPAHRAAGQMDGHHHIHQIILGRDCR